LRKIGSPVRSKERFLVFGAPNIQREEIDEVVACLESGWIGTGPRVARFEQAFSQYKGAQHAAAVSSCTAALQLSLLGAGIRPGDEVVTTPLTFCATINAILHCGATPVLADVDAQTQNIDPAQVAAKIGPRTRAILPVHFAGRPADLDALENLARRHGLLLIEDCAHAIETEFRGRKAGTVGDYGCFSFYVTKNVATGEGGMVLSKDADAIARIKQLALHGMSKDAWKRFGDEGYRHYDVVEAGFKYNMTDLSASLGLGQLARIETGWLRRREIWNRYQEELASFPISLPAPVAADTRHAFHLFTILIDEERAGMSRDSFLEAMTAHHIGIGVHYRAISDHAFYRKKLGWSSDDVPQATRIGRQTVSLPLSAKLTDEDVGDVIEAVKRILRA
jgi:dTDP-4-amino-4,6-dideoxygalactose transaminase